jgi:hypothetical protein
MRRAAATAPAAIDPGLASPGASRYGVVMSLVPCRECRQEISDQAMACPHCGALYPARTVWTGTGFEWQSRVTVLGMPLVHVAFGRDAAGRARIARGVVAIGQVAFGFLAVAQFGLGVLTVAQFGLGVLTVAQFGVGLVFGLGQFILAWAAVAQFAVCFVGEGGFLVSLAQARPLLTSLLVTTVPRWLHAGAFCGALIARARVTRTS